MSFTTYKLWTSRDWIFLDFLSRPNWSCFVATHLSTPNLKSQQTSQFQKIFPLKVDKERQNIGQCNIRSP
jgi:hypothetical protein